VFANKTDINGCMDEEEILKARRLRIPGDLIMANQYFKGLQLQEIKTHRWHVLRCSAMTGENLEDGLAWVVEDAKKRLFLY
jgi:ADP-ribosylation factor-like protein 2